MFKCLPAKSQCEEYNLCVSYNKQLIQRTPNLSQNKSYALHGIWYSDSIAVNQTILTKTNLSGNKCVIVKIDTKGKIIAQADSTIFLNSSIASPYQCSIRRI